MRLYEKFFRDETGAITIDWVALTAGILLLGIMVVYAIFNGGVAGLASNINATLTAVTTGVDTGAAPDLNGGGSGPLVLSDDLSVPVGSIIEPGPIPGLIGFVEPGSGAFIGSTFVNPAAIGLLAGATVTSATTLKLSDGSTGQASDFFEVPPT